MSDYVDNESDSENDLQSEFEHVTTEATLKTYEFSNKIFSALLEEVRELCEHSTA